MNKSVSLLFLATILLGASEGGCGDDDAGPVVLPLVECTPEVCEGCCIDNQCITGSMNDSSCGNGGSECSPCGELFVCSLDGPGCTLDLQASLIVQPTGASITPLDPRDNDSWDIDDSEPDVVVELRCPVSGSDVPLVTRTPEVSSYTPQWTSGGCTTQASALIGRELQIKLIDVDFAFDDEIISFAYTIQEAELRTGSVTLPIPSQGNSVTLKFARLP